MTRRLPFLSLLGGLAGAAALCFSAPAQANPVLVSAGFDDISIPTPPGYATAPVATPAAGATATLPVAIKEGTNASVRVYDSFTDSVLPNTMGGGGDKVLILSDTNTASSSSAIAYADFAGAAKPMTGKVQIALDAIFDSAGKNQTNNEVSFYLTNDTGGSLASYKFRQDTGRVIVTQYLNGATAGSTIGGGNSFLLGQIVHLRIDVDLDANRSSLYINDVLKATTTLTDGSYSMNIDENVGFGGLRITTGSTTTGRVGVNNLMITVPEPASVGVMALAGLLLARRR